MKTLDGIVISSKTPHTVQVSVTRQWQHPLYGKSVKRTKTYACHVDTLEVNEGDVVRISECTPKSKTKRFEVREVLESRS